MVRTQKPAIRYSTAAIGFLLTFTGCGIIVDGPGYYDDDCCYIPVLTITPGTAISYPGDTVRFVATFTNYANPPEKITWKVNGKVRKSRSAPVWEGEGTTLVLADDEPRPEGGGRHRDRLHFAF